jgi:uncharacterized membrane protein YgcG
MATHDTLSHTGSDGSQLSDRISAAGYEFRASAENIAYNYTDPAAVMAGWMGSPGHRANILNENYCEMGVGLAYSDTNQPYWTQNFGIPVNACPAPTNDNPCDDATNSNAEAEASTNTDTAETGESSGNNNAEAGASTDSGPAEAGESSGGGGGCFLTVITVAVP